MKAWPGFDRVVHEPVRFLILESLYTQGMSFSNLEEAGYINSRRLFERRKPSVRYTISELGKRKFEEYVSGMISRLEKSLDLIEKS